MPTNSLFVIASLEAPQNPNPEKSQNLPPIGLKNPRDPRPTTPARSGHDPAPGSLFHFLLSALRTWRLCAPRQFPRSVHKSAQSAQTQNRAPCRAPRVTQTNYYRLDKIGLVSPCASGDPGRPGKFVFSTQPRIAHAAHLTHSRAFAAQCFPPPVHKSAQFCTNPKSRALPSAPRGHAPYGEPPSNEGPY